MRAAIDEQRLSLWMQANVAGFPRPPARFEIQQFQHGQSNPTFLVVADGRKFVVRKKPAGALLPGAHQVEREYRVMMALRGTAVPVPLPLGLCTDAGVLGTPFFVMTYVAGRIFKDPLLPGMQHADRFAIYSELTRVIAALHCVDVKAAGLSDFGKSTDYCPRQLALWDKQYTGVTRALAAAGAGSGNGSGKSSNGTLAAAANADANMNALIAYLKQAVPSIVDESCLTHGDFRLDNVVFHPTEPRIVAVLDWELSTLGHPLSDLAYLCMMFHSPSTGIMPADAQAVAAFQVW